MTARRIVVTGSVAYDYLMTFPGKFLDVVIPDRMDRLSVSFLVDSMRKVRGGVAPNIAYTLALLGLRPLVMATAGIDALDYSRWLAEQGVDTSALHICDDLFTASFFVSTDQAQNQIATFYTGAMARAATLSSCRCSSLTSRSAPSGESTSTTPGWPGPASPSAASMTTR